MNRRFTAGTLREPFLGHPVGSIVQVCQVRASRWSQGPSWWIRVKPSGDWFCVAESYGGRNLCTLVLPARVNGKPVEISEQVQRQLLLDLQDRVLNKFHRPVRPPDGISHLPKSLRSPA